jgi:hypothetical protein
MTVRQQVAGRARGARPDVIAASDHVIGGAGLRRISNAGSEGVHDEAISRNLFR